MKKFLALFLATLFVFLLTSCYNNKTPEENNEQNDIIYISSAKINENGELIISYSNGTEENLGNFKENYVYTTCYTTVNTEPIPDYEYIDYELTLGTELKKVSDDGTWTKVIYNGKEGYVLSETLTDDKDLIHFNYINNKKVFSNEGIVLLKNLSNNSVKTTVPKDTVLTQTGINYKNNFARISYKGQVYYCDPAYLRA